MRTNKLRQWAARAALVSAVSAGALGFTQQASASGFEHARFGSEHGHAAGATPFALYYNPAALSLTKKLHVATGLVLAFHNATFDRASSDTAEPADAQGANTGKAKVGDALFSPAVAASYRINDFVIGLGFFVPFGGLQSWGGGGNSVDQYPGTKDGSARWHLIEGGTTVMYASAGASYTLPKLGLSFGASANFTYSTLEFTRALNALGNDDIGIEGRTHLDVGGGTGSFGLGVLYEAVKDQLWLGLSYQAPPGLYKDLSMSGEVRNLLTGTTALTEKVDLKQSMPDILRFAVRVRPRPSYELRLHGDFTRWSAFERQCLVHAGDKCQVNKDGTAGAGVLLNQPREWKNTFSIKLGGSYYFNELYEGFAGLAYDGNPIPKGTLDPSTIDGHDLTYTLGGRARFADMFGVLLSLSYQQWLERDNSGQSRLQAYSQPSRLPNAGGVYTQNAVILNAMLEFYLN